MSRNPKIDALKGILIISVLVGHLNLCEFVNWFHMPLFFIVSGYLMPVDINRLQSKEWIKNRMLRLLVPYTMYWLLVSMLSGNKIDMNAIFNFIFSGRRLVALFGVWWFPICLLISQCVFFIMLKNAKCRCIKLEIVLYILAILFSFFTLKHPNVIFYIPWNLDVCLLAIPYLAIGRTIHIYITENKNQFFSGKYGVLLLFGSIGIIAILFFLYKYKIYEFIFNMKYGIYRSFLLPIIVPLAFGLIFLCIICTFGAYNRNFLSYLGKNSMVIMYIHQLVFFLMRKLYDGNDFWYRILLLVVAIVVGCVWKKFCEKSKIMSFLFIDGIYLTK